MEIDVITGMIIDSAMEIHKGLGPGLLETVYEVILQKMLTERGLEVQTQKSVTCEFHGITFKDGFRCDLLVNNSVVVELKSVEKIAPVHQKQLLTYLRLMNLEVGLLINFGAATLKEGLQRIVNNHTPSAYRPEPFCIGSTSQSSLPSALPRASTMLSTGLRVTRLSSICLHLLRNAYKYRPPTFTKGQFHETSSRLSSHHSLFRNLQGPGHLRGHGRRDRRHTHPGRVPVY